MLLCFSAITLCPLVIITYIFPTCKICSLSPSKMPSIILSDSASESRISLLNKSDLEGNKVPQVQIGQQNLVFSYHSSPSNSPMFSIALKMKSKLPTMSYVTSNSHLISLPYTHAADVLPESPHTGPLPRSALCLGAVPQFFP